MPSWTCSHRIISYDEHKTLESSEKRYVNPPSKQPSHLDIPIDAVDVVLPRTLLSFNDFYFPTNISRTLFFTNGYDTDQWNFYDIFPKISVWCSLASPAPLTAHHSARLWLLLLHRRFFAFFMCARESYESCDPVYVEYDGSWAWHTMESSGKKTTNKRKKGFELKRTRLYASSTLKKKAIEARQFGMEFRFFCCEEAKFHVYLTAFADDVWCSSSSVWCEFIFDFF